MAIFILKIIEWLRSSTFGLGRKLSLIFGGLISAFVAAALYNNLLIQLEFVNERREERAAYFGKLVVEVSIPYLLEFRTAELEVIYEELYGQSDVAYVFFLDDDNIELVTGADADSESFLNIVDDALADLAHETTEPQRSRDAEVENFAIPIVLGNRYFGTIRYGLLLDGYQNELKRVWGRNLLLGAIFVFSAVALSNYFASRVSRPLRRLTEISEKAAYGNLDQSIELHSNDELGVLAKSFNTMLGTMRENILEVHNLAYRDGLTDLPNRAWFTNYLDQALQSAQSGDQVVALLFLDLDNFKQINDTLGHHMGDQLLSAFAKRLEALLLRSGRLLPADELERPEHANSGGYDGVVARLGGDEFTVILPDIQSPDEARMIAESIVDTMERPFEINGRVLETSVSVGIALFPDHASSQQDLLKLADTAMYQAKKAGRSTFQFFDVAIHEADAERALLERDLRVAIEQDQFEIYFQPQFQVSTGKVAGAETLVRWRHPEKGMIQPDDFIPVAESSGLMPSIGRLILRRALVSAKQIPQFAKERLWVAVNVSVDEVEDPRFAAWLKEQLEETGFDPNLLELEITENTAMSDSAGFEGQVHELRKLGVSFAVDDFGMGYSNLGRLKSLHFETLKIDKSLLTGIGSDPSAELLLSTIIDMAAALRLDVVAEGIENTKQWDFLGSNACRYAQGYLLARPMPFDQFRTWLMSVKPFDSREEKTA